jgi:hypothetical protein
MGYCLACGRNRTDIVSGFCKQCREDEARKDPASAKRRERVNECLQKWHDKPGHKAWYQEQMP